MYHTIKSYITANFKLLGAAFVLGAVLPLSLGALGLPGGNFLANVTSEYNYEKPATGQYDLDDAIVDYSLEANDITNEFLEGMLSADDPNVIYVADESDCENDNYSTFCLAKELNANFTAFDTGLDSYADEFQMKDVDTGNIASTIEEAIAQHAARSNSIEYQREVGAMAMDLTLAVYNQVQLVYPVHTELSKLFSNLEEFSSNLASVRDVIELFPSKFNGASTIQCK